MIEYREEMKEKYILKIRELLKELPVFCEDVFVGIENKVRERSRYGYAHDLRGFFKFIITEIDEFKNIETMRDIMLLEMNKITSLHIEKFLSHTSNYMNNGKKLKNGESGKARKLAAIRSVYKYLYKNKLVSNNPAVIVETPDIPDKNIIKLEPNEVVDLLDTVEDGVGLTERQKKYYPLICKRDLAIIALLVGTGIRVSECVGIDLTDINFSTNGIQIIRKGNKISTVYMPEEVSSILKEYLHQRQYFNCMAGSENALFISLQRKRISVNMVERIIKKHTEKLHLQNKISPHKLRSTYGTNLYRETGDIYLVAESLGHKDVNTTKKHYADMDEEHRKLAAKVTKLRKI